MLRDDCSVLSMSPEQRWKADLNGDNAPVRRVGGAVRHFGDTRRSGRTATTRFVVISRPNGDPDALLRESGCRLAEVKLAGQ
jgi:hypothetical protein